MSDYKPGPVAVATVRGVPNVRAFRLREGTWVTDKDIHTARVHHDDKVTDVRPLVVLDLDKVYACEAERDPAAVVRYLRQTSSAAAYAIADQIEAQTRPPRPAEPTGLGAVVEDAEGRRYVRTDFAGGSWHDTADDDPTAWHLFDAVRVLSEGVTQ